MILVHWMESHNQVVVDTTVTGLVSCLLCLLDSPPTITITTTDSVSTLLSLFTYQIHKLIMALDVLILLIQFDFALLLAFLPIIFVGLHLKHCILWSFCEWHDTVLTTLIFLHWFCRLQISYDNYHCNRCVNNYFMFFLQPRYHFLTRQSLTHCYSSH